MQRGRLSVLFGLLFDKLQEELHELAAEIFPDGQIPHVPASVQGPVIADADLSPEVRKRAEDELGDVLFVLANIARRWGINPEEALRKSNRKFMRRFQAIEQALDERGTSIDDASLEEMEQHYQAFKATDRPR